MTVLSKARKRWLQFVEVLGNIQLTILLSLVYWTIFAIIAIPFKLFADPLALRNPRRANWNSRERASDILESMRKQG